MSMHVNAFAKGLVSAQFTPNSKLVVWTKDIAEGMVAQLGAMKAGVQVNRVLTCSHISRKACCSTILFEYNLVELCHPTLIFTWSQTGTYVD
jgi:hypothetical protein